MPRYKRVCQYQDRVLVLHPISVLHRIVDLTRLSDHLALPSANDDAR